QGVAGFDGVAGTDGDGDDGSLHGSVERVRIVGDLRTLAAGEAALATRHGGAGNVSEVGDDVLGDRDGHPTAVDLDHDAEAVGRSAHVISCLRFGERIDEGGLE